MSDSSQGLRRALNVGAEGTIKEILAAGLRDRDYENLSTGDRLQAHATIEVDSLGHGTDTSGVHGPGARGDQGGEAKRVVVECADIEPGVEICRHLLATEAGALMEGALIVAFATSSDRVVVHVANDDARGAAAVTAAAEAITATLAGTALDGITVELVPAPFRRNMKGYEEVATLLVTGETLVQVRRILRDGVEAFRALGTPDSPGTKLFQVTGCVTRPGIYEVPLGTNLATLLEEHAGGVSESESLKAVIVGGIKGVCLRPDELDISLDFDSIQGAGGTIGSGAVAVLNETACIVDETKHRISVSCYDLCATCSLGREGSYQLREIVADATRGKSKGSDVEMMREVGRGMRVGGACQFGRTAPNILLSALDKFPEEWEAHMKRKLCRPLVCDHYVTFHILPDLCDGCGACVDVCPEDAIEGGKRKIHVIDQDLCEKCGKCLDVCNGLRQAVVKAGPVKPRTPKRPVPVGSWKS